MDKQSLIALAVVVFESLSQAEQKEFLTGLLEDWADAATLDECLQAYALLKSLVSDSMGEGVNYV